MGQFSPDASAVHDRSDNKYQIQRRSRGKSDGNGWKWMEMDGNGWKWMEMADSRERDPHADPSQCISSGNGMWKVKSFEWIELKGS